MAKTAGPQAQKTAETRRKIFLVGRRLIRENGCSKVTIQDILKEADLSIGTFYYHFPSKNALIMEIFREQNSFFEDERVEDYSRADCVIEIQHFFERYANMMGTLSVEDIYEVFFSAGGNKTLLADSKEMHQKLAEIIEGFQKAGKLTPEPPPKQMRQELFICARGVVYDWCLHDGGYPLKDTLLRIITNYIHCYVK